MSLVGVRGCALAKGALVESTELSDIDHFLRSDDLDIGQTTLWGYSAQCNVTGSRIGLQLAREFKGRNQNTAVVVDATAPQSQYHTMKRLTLSRALSTRSTCVFQNSHSTL